MSAAHDSGGRLDLVAAWLRPVGAAMATLLGAIAAVVLLVTLAPGDALDMLTLSPDLGDEVRRQWCIGCPWYEQVGHRVAQLVVGDFGVSISYRQGADVLALITPALIRSLATVAMALAFAFMAASAVLVLRRRGGRPGRLLVAVAAFGATVPAFLIAIVVWRLGAAGLGLTVGPAHLVVAALILGLADAGLTDLSTRLDAELRAAQATDHVVAARANQDGPLRVTALTLAGPVLEIAAARFSVMSGAVMLVEIPLHVYGIGQLLAEAAASRDMPVVAGCLVALAAVVSGVHLAKDVARTALDPRLRRPVVHR